uniref:Signal peptidase complex subunit 3 n=1 Tax=Syphacia muris TaxID=451379 RepID=A0A0N5AJ69_9BILA
MHNIWSRANAVFAFFLSVLSVMIFAVFISTIHLPNSTDVVISADNVRVKDVMDYASGGRSDAARMDLSVQVDLTSIFNWNVKQVFLYLVVEYATALNKVVVWDKIVKRQDWRNIHELHVMPKYYLMDDGRHLLNHPNATLVLRWNIIPNAGYLALAQGVGQHIIKFPTSYYSGRF